jgi:hypothetical protein
VEFSLALVCHVKFPIGETPPGTEGFPPAGFTPGRSRTPPMARYGPQVPTSLLRGTHLFRQPCVCFSSLILQRFSTKRDVRDMPDKTSNEKGTLLLGHLEDDSTDEHLNTGEQRPFFTATPKHAEISDPMAIFCRPPASFRL